MLARYPGRLLRCCALSLVLATAPCGLVQAAPSSFADAAAQTAGKVWAGAQDVTMYALGLIGVNYKFGGSTPDTGLDCSGLVRYVFQEVTGVTLPRTAKEMSALGAKVGAGDLQPGDLVFFNTRRFAFSHVGIYLGDNRFVHAPSRGSEVTISQLSQSYWQKHFDGARRLVGVVPSLAPALISQAQAADTTIDVASSLPTAYDATP